MNRRTSRTRFQYRHRALASRRIRFGTAKVSVVLTADYHRRDERRAGQIVAVVVQFRALASRCREWRPPSADCRARAGTATRRREGTAERGIRHPALCATPRPRRVRGIWSAHARMASTTTPPDGRKLLRGGTIQCRIAPTDAVGDGSAIVAPDPATATSSRNNSANSRPSSGRSGLIRNVQRPERGCPTIGPSGTPPLCKCALTACPSRAGIVIAHTDPARSTIRPSSGGSITAGRSHSRR